MHKRVLIIMIVIFAMSISFCFAANPMVQINGEIIDFTDSAGNKVEAQIINSRTMVPLRKIFEVLDCSVDWDEPTKTVTATKKNMSIILQIGNKEAKLIDNTTKKEQIFELDSEPVIVSNRTLVPFRFIGESLGMTVAWDADTSTAIIIDFDSLAQVINSKSKVLYSNLLGNYISIERKYYDDADSSFNNTTKLTIESNKKNDGTTVNITINGTSDFAKEVKTEEWENVSYTVFENGDIYTDNYALSNMLGIEKSTNTTLNYAKYGILENDNSSLKDWIKSVTNIDEKRIKTETYSKLKSEWTKFADTFLSSNNKKLSADNFGFSYIDFGKILSSRGTKTQDCLIILNKILFRYLENFQDILSDYPEITYSFQENDGEGSDTIKIAMKNEYKERIEYTIIFKK